MELGGLGQCPHSCLDGQLRRMLLGTIVEEGIALKNSLEQNGSSALALTIGTETILQNNLTKQEVDGPKHREFSLTRSHGIYGKTRLREVNCLRK